MNESEKYITIKKAVKTYGISAQSFRKWEREGKIKCLRTPTNIRLINVENIKCILGINNDQTKFRKIVYCRVSSKKQTNDLNRQIKQLSELYPSYDIISDISSGINFSRKGLQTILELSMRGELEEIVVAHKDRLCRFGYELIEFIITTNGGKITIVDNKDIQKTDEQELAEDLLAIVHVFSCKQMGKRRYRSKTEED